MPDPNVVVEVRGNLERITFHNPDNFFTIARFRPEQGSPPITLLGHLPHPRTGETLKVRGHWEHHPRYGPQLRVETCETVLPGTADGIRRYLESGMVKGLGKRAVARLVNHFGAETLTVIESAPERLQEVKGIGSKLADRIAVAWQMHHTARMLMGFLQENGIPTAYGAKLLQTYGDNALVVLNEDPFQAAQDIPGIGFLVADQLSRNRGLEVDEPRRVRACVAYLLDRALSAGHTYLSETDLLEQCQTTFDVSETAGRYALDMMISEGILIEEEREDGIGTAIFLAHLHEAETQIARRLQTLMTVPPDMPPVGREAIVDTVMHRLAIQLSDEQLEVVCEVLGNQVSVVTGGPGTGKTTVIRSIAAVFRHHGRRVCLAAPTGRAARRLSEVTGEQASTIHKLLGFSPGEGRFARDRDDPLDADVVIVDEASMVDVLLMHNLVLAIRMNAVLILVGDGFQLPPVGPGAVLSDIVRSGWVPVFWLERIFRQESESPIVVNAHRIREGLQPEFQAPEALASGAQFVMIEAEQPAAGVQTLVELCTRVIPGYYHLLPVRDIQVLTPMHRGEVGTVQLNQILQEKLNPVNSSSGEHRWQGFWPGDKVMHLRNNYTKDVFNGDIGTVAAIEPGRERLEVSYEGRRVAYDLAELDELTLAYAISIHKSQGSEYPVVVIPLFTQHYPLLQRNLLYTAITRGRQLVVIVGTLKAVGIALRNDKPRRRLSGLGRRLSIDLSK